MLWKEIKLRVSDAVKRLLEERQISEDEVKQVIHHAESGGVRSYTSRRQTGTSPN